MAVGDTGRGVGAGLDSFSRTLGQFLLTKFRNDEAAKRQKADDQRQLLFRGFFETMRTNPGALVQSDLQSIGKNFGLKPEDSEILRTMLSGAQQRLDAEQAAFAQQQAQFDNLLFGGAAPQAPQASVAPLINSGVADATPQPAQPPGAPTLGAQQQQLNQQLRDLRQTTQREAPEIQRMAQEASQNLAFISKQINPPLAGPEAPTPQPFQDLRNQSAAPTPPALSQAPTALEPSVAVEPPTFDFGPIPQLPDDVAAQLTQLRRIAPGRKLTVRSPDGKRSLTLDREAGINSVIGGLISQGLSPFDTFRAVTQQIPNAKLPAELRKAAALDGLSRLVEQRLSQPLDPSAFKSGSINLPQLIQQVQQQGLFIDPTEVQDIAEPLFQRVLTGNRRRIEKRREFIMNAMKLTDDPDELATLREDLVLNTERAALRTTVDQMDGLGMTPEQQRAMQDQPTADEMRMELALAGQEDTVAGHSVALSRFDRSEIQRKAAEADATTRSRTIAEKQTEARGSITPAREVIGIANQLIQLRQQGLSFDNASTAAGLVKEYNDTREAFRTLLARGSFGQKGNLTAEEQDAVLSALPTLIDITKAPDLAVRKLERFQRLLQSATGLSALDVGGSNSRSSLTEEPDVPLDDNQEQFLESILP